MTYHESVFEEVIYRMTITRNGRTIRRKDGRPWKIVIRRSKWKQLELPMPAHGE